MREDLPLVSVIVPAYMEEKFLGKCLRSIRNQTYGGEIEIIVIDSNSSDGTRDIAQKQADTVINLKGRGIAKARNAGVKASKGGLLLFLDADTMVSRNMIEECVKNFEKDGVVGAVPAYHVSAGSFLQRMAYRLSSFIVRFSVIVRRPIVPTMCACYSRKVFDVCGGFNEALVTCEDFDLSKRMAKHGRVVYFGNAWAATSPRRLERFSASMSVKPALEFLMNKEPNVKLWFHVSEMPRTNNFTFIMNQLYSYGNSLASREYYHRNYHRLSENVTEIKYRIKKEFRSIGTSVRETFME